MPAAEDFRAAGVAGAAVHVFLGKGGVGKTTCAAATALQLAESGESSLAISTDPIPSLSHIFGITGVHREREVLPSLFMTELGLADVRAMWNERFGREVYEVFSTIVDIDYPSFVQFVTSVLPGLNEEFMVDYIRRLALSVRYRHILWDTAPLGQTLALLAMPSLLTEHLRIAPRVYSHLKASGENRESVMAVIRGWQQLAADCMEFLRLAVRFSLVTIPEALAVSQLDGVVEANDSAFLERKAEQQRPHLEWLRERYGTLPIVEIPLCSEEVRGTGRLRAVGRLLRAAPVR